MGYLSHQSVQKGYSNRPPSKQEKTTYKDHPPLFIACNIHSDSFLHILYTPSQKTPCYKFLWEYMARSYLNYKLCLPLSCCTNSASLLQMRPGQGSIASSSILSR